MTVRSEGGYAPGLSQRGPYATDWFSRGSRQSALSDAYEPVRAQLANDFVVGDPDATTSAILDLVDAAEPPARLILGRVFDEIEALYRERLDTRRAWQPVSRRAFGNPVEAEES